MVQWSQNAATHTQQIIGAQIYVYEHELYNTAEHTSSLHIFIYENDFYSFYFAHRSTQNNDNNNSHQQLYMQSSLNTLNEYAIRNKSPGRDDDGGVYILMR